jgi:hypothetical protein
MYAQIIIIAVVGPVNLERQSLPLKIMNRSAAPVERLYATGVVMIF